MEKQRAQVTDHYVDCDGITRTRLILVELDDDGPDDELAEEVAEEQE